MRSLMWRMVSPVAQHPARELLPHFLPHGFLGIHRQYVVNLRRVREIRRRAGSREWEVKVRRRRGLGE